MNERKKWLDICKGIAMCCIVFSHTSSGTGGGYELIYLPIFLSVFFFSTGYLFKPCDFKSELLYVFRHLVIPLVSLGTINAVISFVVEGEAIIPRMTKLLLQTSGNRDDMWFIACLTSAHILFWLVHKVVRDKKIELLLTTLIISLLGGYYAVFIGFALPWKFQRALGYLIFMGAGYVYRRTGKQIDKYFDKRIVVMLGLIYFLSCITYGGKFFGDSLGDICISAVGICFIIMISKYIHDNKILVFIGQNTLVYYAFQSKVIKVLELFAGKAGVSTTSVFCGIVVSILTIVALAVPAFVFNKVSA